MRDLPETQRHRCAGMQAALDHGIIREDNFIKERRGFRPKRMQLYSFADPKQPAKLYDDEGLVVVYCPFCRALVGLTALTMKHNRKN